MVLPSVGVELWDVPGGALFETVNHGVFRVCALAYSPHGNLFLTGDEDGTVALSTNVRGSLGQNPLAFEQWSLL